MAKVAKVSYHDCNSKLYICPFFHSEIRRGICCEGFEPNTRNWTNFDRRQYLERYREEYCFGFQYGRCHWADLLLKHKYNAP